MPETGPVVADSGPLIALATVRRMDLMGKLYGSVLVPGAGLREMDRRPMDDLDSEWQRKGATLSDKTARKEFGLTQDEIVQAIRTGKLHCREASMHGNPWLRLLRREVEVLIKKKHGDDYLKDQQAKTELARINRELKRLKIQIAALEERKAKLMADFAR